MKETHLGENVKFDRLWVAVLFLLTGSQLCLAQKADWPQPRHDRQLTGIQPAAGDIKAAPSVLGEIELERAQPAWIDVKMGPNRPDRRLTIIAGELRAYDTRGRLIWATHPRGINFSQIVAAGDLSDDGHIQIALTAGRSAQPYGAAMLVSADDGSIIWRYDVEPMSYSWNLYVFDHAGTGGKASGPKQLFVVMQGYPPDEKNGYCVLFAHTPGKNQTQGGDGGWYQKWRYDFSQYTCFPDVSQVDLSGAGFYDDIPIITHSRLWLMDRRDGTVKQFLEWDTSPANHRSYGLNQFVDLNGDGRLDFLCLGYFAKHYEVLLNKDGKFTETWHYGWDDSVTTSNIGLTWPLPPYGDMDGNGKMDVVVSVFNADGKHKWEIRVHDAVTGKLIYTMPGMIAARLVDVDGDGAPEILADRSDEGADAGNSGDYTIHHPTGAVLLKVIDGRLQPVWEDKAAVAIREKPDSVRGKDMSLARIRVGQEVRILQPGAHGTITSQRDPTGVAPAANPAPAPGEPELLAADFFGEGRNQLLVYRGGTATIWRWKGDHFESAGQYPSSCLPVISDLNGDGKLDLVLANVSAQHQPRYTAITPALKDKVLWDVTLPPPAHAGMPAVRLAYMRAGKFTGRQQDDVYIWAATPFMRSAVLRGDTGALVWDKYESSVAERYWGPSMNLASVCDFNGDGKDDLIFTNPDQYCVADGPTGDPLLGPLNQQKIFSQSSLGLYTMPVLLGEAAEKIVCLVGGHYFQAALSLHAKPMWYKLPPTGAARCANEGFINIGSSEKPQWLMGFGRQNGKFACVNVSDGSLRWEFDTGGSCSDVVGCDIDGDGRPEFIFGTSHGTIYALGDDAEKPRIVWKIETGVEESAPILADMNGDGKPEVIFAGSDARVRVFGKSGGTSLPTSQSTTVNPAPLARDRTSPLLHAR
jgi:outer membrane protein assembly factor BamB